MSDDYNAGLEAAAKWHDDKAVEKLAIATSLADDGQKMKAKLF